jgi:hypothetical protein
VFTQLQLHYITDRQTYKVKYVQHNLFENALASHCFMLDILQIHINKPHIGSNWNILPERNLGMLKKHKFQHSLLIP